MRNCEPFDALWNRALWYLGRRDYGANELRLKLLRPRPDKPAPLEEDVDRAIERLIELDLLNDERYAQRLAEALSRKGYGARGIAFELRKRGLSEEIEPPAPDEERIGELLRSKYAAKLGDEKGRQSAFNALVRKGFSYSDVKAAMRQTMEEEFDGDF
ncbi:MAG: recombination regulator RecX [Oscillospiraceae bacterium]|jgi:regulatory protein|nr:recombination regulator RecX [Oscillospiraceae bacterium]